MIRSEDDCSNCDEVVEFVRLGMIPLSAIEETDDNLAWVNAQVCTECGGYDVIRIGESDIRRADERYVHTLIEEGVISRDRGRSILGLDAEE
jgi:hypothetical protein